MDTKLVAGMMKAHGWIGYRDGLSRADLSFYKRFDTPTRCRCNDDKPGIQITAHFYAKSEIQPKDSLSLRLSGEVEDGSWYEIQRYGFKCEIREVLQKTAAMLDAWEAASNAKG